MFSFTLIALTAGILSPGTLNAQTSQCDEGFESAYDSSFCDTMPGCDGLAAQPASCYEEFKLGLAASGISLSSNLTQFYFGTVDGGIRRTDRYGGHGDYLARLDLGKLGLQEGLFVQLRAEHRFGQSVNGDAAAILPATLATDLPVNDSRELFLSNVLFTQFLSESFAVYGGKLDTLDGDQNAYASGRGISQFSNTAMIANPIALRTVPYSSLGFGFLILSEGEPLLNFLVMNPTDTVETDGFDELFSEGVAISSELRFRTNGFGRPGHQLFGATWSSREFTALGQDPRIILPNIPVRRSNGSWSLYWNTDQALWVDPCDANRNWGLFARAGIADDDANPISYFLSGGLGGASPWREGDSFGLGYYFSGTSDEVGPILETALGPIGDGQGVELFYRAQVTNALSITPDVQWLSQTRQNIPDAYVMGLRVNLQF
ncbi:MAG: carbohydrate porin [Planctomycetota bacterium]